VKSILKIVTPLTVYVILLACAFAGKQTMDESQINKLLKEASSDNFYVHRLIEANQVVYEGIPSAHFKKHTIFRILLLDPGFEEHNFIIAVKKYPEKATILTDSLDGLNSVIATEKIDITDVEVLKEFALEAMGLIRPLYKRWHVIDDLDNFKAVTKGKHVPVKYDSFKFTKAQDGKSYIGQILLLIDKDLVNRSVTWDGKKFGFIDKILVKDLVDPTNPHS